MQFSDQLGFVGHVARGYAGYSGSSHGGYSQSNYGYGYPARTRAEEVAIERDRKLGEIVSRDPIACEAHMEFLYNITGKVCEQEKGFMSAIRSKPEQCPENPNCFADLGQERRRNKKDEDVLRERLGAAPELRGKNDAVGLRNMGSTCYLNSLVQCLYANTTFRQALYSYSVTAPGSASSETAASSSSSAASSSAASSSSSSPSPSGRTSSRAQIALNLQYLFAQMQDSEDKAIRPEEFVTALGIDPKVQQDAEEFYNLLVTFLETLFAKNTRPELEHFVRDELTGMTSYVTSCTCSREGRNRHPFYHIGLPITGCTKLTECLDNYMRPEALDGYRCESCDKLNTSSRRTEITRTPPVLNLTLMRFIFDLQRGDKKKLTHDISFPDELSMQQYVKLEQEASGADSSSKKTKKESRLRKLFSRNATSAEGGLVYELRAVVSHIGQSAHGGHYISYVLQKESGNWYQFDDAEVTVMKTPPWRQNRARAPYPGYQYPDEAPIERYETPYMLVYRLKDHPEATPVPPEALKGRLQAGSALVREQLSHWNAQKPVVLEELKRERLQFEDLMKKIAVDPRDPNYFWVSTDWLKRWMRDSSEIGPIDNNSLLCQHDRVNFKQLNHMKRVSPFVWNYLYEKYRGGPALTQDHLCTECATHYIVNQRERRDGKLRREKIMSEIRPSIYSAFPSSGPSYYVSSQWMRGFKSHDGIASTHGTDLCADIACQHGRLTINASAIEKISEKAWNMIIETYFPNRSPTAPVFRSSEEPCPVCHAERQLDENNRKQLMRARSDERHPFEAIYLGNKSDCRRIDPKPGQWVPLTRRWLKAWRLYCDKFGEPAGPIDHGELICTEHGLFKCDWERELSISIRKTLFELVPLELYQRLADFYGETSPAPIIHVLERNLAESRARGFRLMYGKPSYTYKVEYPRGFCESCAETFKLLQREQDLQFENEKIFIRSGKSVYRRDIEITLSHGTSINALKYEIYQQFNIHPSQQMLTFEEKILTDGTLRDYEVVPPGPIEVERVASQGFSDGRGAGTSSFGGFTATDRPPRREETAFENSALMRADLTNSTHVDNEDNEDDDEERGIREPAEPPIERAPSEFSDPPIIAPISSSSPSSGSPNFLVTPAEASLSRQPSPQPQPQRIPSSPQRAPSPQPPRSPRNRTGIDFSQAWTCIHCTFENAPSTTGICEICSKTQVKEGE